MPVWQSLQRVTQAVEVVGSIALLTRPGDVDDLRNALLKYLEAPLLRERSGEMGRKRLDGNFSWAVVARRYVKIYEAVIAARKYK